MTFKTKMRKNAGSIITTIPSELIKLLKLGSGDKAVWTVDIKENEIEIKLDFEKESKE